jgi:beta-glucosidase
MKSPCLLLSSLAAASALEPWMDLQATPEQRTAALVANLTNDEKVHYFHGSGSGYVGNVAAQRNGAIPAIKMNDGPQGFRDNAHLGTTTSWPSALAVSATWNPATAGAWGEGMGQEFFDKGANVQLGPGMCVARVPRNGRNFEYLSGEDPVLGVNMVPPVVKGIQSKGVIANAKHYVNNNQETNRGDVSENVDERTQLCVPRRATPANATREIR